MIMSLCSFNNGIILQHSHLEITGQSLHWEECCSYYLVFVKRKVEMVEGARWGLEKGRKKEREGMKATRGNEFLIDFLFTRSGKLTIQR